MNKNGQGVAEDMTEAVACYKNGAELGTCIIIIIGAQSMHNILNCQHYSSHLLYKATMYN